SGDQKNKGYAAAAGVNALNDHYRRTGIKARAQIGALDGWYTTRYELEYHPLVSILIPNKDHIDDLDKCIQSLSDKSVYDRYEIIIIENNSKDPETFAYYKNLQKVNPRVRVVYWEHDFNYSAINNFGRRYARGEYLLLLNNDVEVITPDILENMLGYCMRKDVGIVGAKLLYDDHTVQHAGVLVGAGGLADHVFKGLHEDAPGYMGRASTTQDLSAVTAACLMVPAKVYDEVGGLDESFKVAFNDVDFCLKVRAAGYLVVYDADVKLYHYESKSRGSEDTAERFIRFGDEMQRLNVKWGILVDFTDPYYNPNFSYIHYYKLNYTAMEARQKRVKAYVWKHQMSKERAREEYRKEHVIKIKQRGKSAQVKTRNTKN
ncbi:MAG: glycosyltransferase family 2 protein, partial [Parasporobacterium sp.]|nr:glycosyltransferase family 2 protein [Parasporobacterium sp.]